MASTTFVDRTTPIQAAWLNDVNTAVYKESFNVKNYGATGDGITDDTAAIVAASIATGTSNLVFPPGTYKVTSALTIPTNQHWLFLGGQRSSSLSKAFNGDLITMSTLSGLTGANLICNGGSFTGRGIYVPSGFSQTIDRVRVDSSAGICLEFADSVGGGANITRFEGITTSPTTIPAIKITDTLGPSPKFFNGIWLSGGSFDLSSGGNGSSINNFYIRDFITGTGSVLFHASNGRCATGGATLSIFGSELSFTNVAIAGPVLLKSTSGGITLDPSCSIGSPITEETGASSNRYFDAGQSYNSVWSQISGTPPAIGNGVTTSAFSRHGPIANVALNVTFGSTSTFGNSGTAYRFSLPFTARAGFSQTGIAGTVTIGSTTYAVNGQIDAAGTDIYFLYNGQSVRLGFPAAFTSGSQIQCNFSYIVK